MQIDRLLDMVLLLLEKKTVTAGELAQRFGCSSRTIYRDLDTLSLAGIPVTSSKGHGGGIRLLPGYTLDKALLSEKERQEILFALQGLGAARYPEAEATLEKLRGLFVGSARQQWIQVDFTQWGGGAQEKEKFSLLREGILGKRVLAFTYTNGNGQVTRRRVEGLRLLYKAQSWYLWGYCQGREDFRLFRLSRMDGLEVGAERFQREWPPEESIPLEYLPAPPAIRLVLRFASAVAHRVYDEFGPANATALPDGSLEVACPMPFDEWMMGYLLSFGPHVQVLEPAHVREALRERIRAMAEPYAQD